MEDAIVAHLVSFGIKAEAWFIDSSLPEPQTVYKDRGRLHLLRLYKHEAKVSPI